MYLDEMQLLALVLLSVMAASVYALAAAKLWQLGNQPQPQCVRVVIAHERATGMSTVRRGVVDTTGRWFVINGQRQPLPNGVRLAPGTIMVLSHLPGSHVLAWNGAR
jgi:hypothetical protein